MYCPRMSVLKFFRTCMGGVGAAVDISTAPLYRYPYRNSMEAMVGDWRRIGKDIQATTIKLREQDYREEPDEQ